MIRMSARENENNGLKATVQRSPTGRSETTDEEDGTTSARLRGENDAHAVATVDPAVQNRTLEDNEEATPSNEEAGRKRRWSAEKRPRRHRRMITVGIVLLMVGIAFGGVIVPEVKVLPASLSVNAEVAGEISMLNTTNAQWDHYNVTVVSKINVQEVHDDTAIVYSKMTILDADTGEPIEMLNSNASLSEVDRRTFRYTDDPINGNASGFRWNFPIGLEQRDYKIWSGDIQRPMRSEFVGEEERHGITTYKYVQRIENGSNDMVPLEGTQMTISINNTYWLEPYSGQAVDFVQRQRRYLIAPDLKDLITVLKIVPDIDLSAHYIGELDMINLTSLEMDHFNFSVDGGVEIIETIGDTILMNQTIEVFNEDLNETIEDFSGVDTYGINTKSFRFVTEYCSGNETGYWRFPLGVEPQDYMIYNTYAFREMPYRYNGTRDLNGLETYAFVQQFENARTSPYIVDENLTMEMFVDYYAQSWVQPSTGLEVDGYVKQTMFVECPDFSLLDSNQSRTVTLTGHYLWEDELGTSRQTSVKDVRSFATVAATDETLTIDASRRLIDSTNGQTLTGDDEILTIDRKTGLQLATPTDTDVPAGHWCFPRNVERRPYSYFDPLVGERFVYNYSQSAKIDNMTTYRFEADATDIAIGWHRTYDKPVVADVESAVWVEPTSGVIVDRRINLTRYIVHEDGLHAFLNQTLLSYDNATINAQMDRAWRHISNVDFAGPLSGKRIKAAELWYQPPREGLNETVASMKDLDEMVKLSDAKSLAMTMIVVPTNEGRDELISMVNMLRWLIITVDLIVPIALYTTAAILVIVPASRYILDWWRQQQFFLRSEHRTGSKQ